MCVLWNSGLPSVSWEFQGTLSEPDLGGKAEGVSSQRWAGVRQCGVFEGQKAFEFELRAVRRVVQRRGRGR